ncbi:HNH endonuclease [Azospira restricta]|uniref:HNH endonuclease n=1 Tax=Azospira restricta TaxID=404405 RepID=A0A974PVI0_9RHOO|nr:HNH endonuclease [Azospira restricta]
MDLHHIEWVRDGGGNDPSNLVPLCGYCHDLHTRGHIPASAIRVWKAVLTALNTPNRTTVDTLLHLKRLSGDSIGQHAVYSGGDLLQLAPLINGGLVSAEGTQAGSGSAGRPPFAVFRVLLTQKGQDLVEAWIAGSSERLANSLSPEVGYPPLEPSAEERSGSAANY